jgi:hypothetical protein
MTSLEGSQFRFSELRFAAQSKFSLPVSDRDLPCLPSWRARNGHAQAHGAAGPGRSVRTRCRSVCQSWKFSKISADRLIYPMSCGLTEGRGRAVSACGTPKQAAREEELSSGGSA